MDITSFIVKIEASEEQKILHLGRIFNYVGKSSTVILVYLTLSSILLIVRRQLLQGHQS